MRATIGDGWITDLYQLRALEKWAADATFQAEFQRVKRSNKEQLAKVIADTVRIKVDPASLFDIHVKRIHAYKRQLLNVMHIIDDYLALIDDNRHPALPRTYVFAGKAAPGYWVAKQFIKLIHHVGRAINGDPRANDWIKVVFLPDYRVSLAEKVIPAADLSEQISTAGKEASGTSNMKFALNGAITIGTLDGANIEILHELGKKNILIFGLATFNLAMGYEMDRLVSRPLRSRQSSHSSCHKRCPSRVKRMLRHLAQVSRSPACARSFRSLCI